MFGRYNDFRLENTLIRQLYPTSPQGADVDGQDPTTETRAKQAMLRTHSDRARYWYNYHELLLASLLSSLCCCLKSKSCYELRQRKKRRHEDAVKKLRNELDVCNVIQTLRFAHFLSKIFLRKHQRLLVGTFRRYQVSNLAGVGENSDEVGQLVTVIQLDDE